MESYAGDAKLPLPRALLRPALPLTARLMALKNKAARRDRARRPRGAAGASSTASTRWIAEGLLGGEQPNAADLQIGSTIRLLMSIGDVRPLIEGRPAARARALLPAAGRRGRRRAAAGRVAAPRAADRPPRGRSAQRVQRRRSAADHAPPSRAAGVSAILTVSASRRRAAQRSPGPAR